MTYKKSKAASPTRRSVLAGGLAAVGAATLMPRSAFALTDEVIAAAKAEGTVTFYSVVPETIAQPFVEGFEAKYGIDLDYQRLTSGAMGQRYAGEADAGAVVADALAMTDRFFMNDASAKGWLAPVTELDDSADFPEQFRTENFYMVQLLPHGLAYNTGQVEGAPDWQSLIDPSMKGRLTLVDPRNGFYTSVFYYALREAFGEDYLKALAAQEPRLVESATLGAQQVAAGASAICAPAYPNLLPTLKEQGAPIELAMPEPTVASSVLAGISKDAPHPNAAKVLMSFLLGEEGQALYNSNNTSPLGELPGTLPAPAITDIDLDAVKAAQPEIFAALGVS
ncbi:ABC transporter substrate-binding protein [Oceanicola sp. 502str15]|uniref:ABC transporter substrate-binding protein n=1 Tax=Oceanicola sp. 502str15 TaxID=2696061 RepID=UPI00209522C6|nr:extracellular solute-binding protein [Oceanicola sp. 502str15]MCO6383442.1 extracellular solute-binding protein [Oceanicola sp. 502str15]